MYKGRNVTAVIAEFNPFHHGHKYLFDRIRDQFPDGIIIAIMSGDFVQRGEPAFFSKYERTREALINGADLVVELPLLFSLSSAEGFSAGGISLIRSLGIVDTVSFGSESGDISLLNEMALFSIERKTLLDERLREGLKRGLNYPSSLGQAFQESGFPVLEANDLLGLEYLKALYIQNGRINVFPVKRDKTFPSAHSLRDNLRGVEGSIDIDMLSDMLSFTLLKGRREWGGKDFSEYLDVSEELNNALIRTCFKSLSVRERILSLKSKNYSYLRIQRALMHILLGIGKKEALEVYRSLNKAFPYIRALGVKKDEMGLLSEIKVKIITSEILYLKEISAKESTEEWMLKLNTRGEGLYSVISGKDPFKTPFIKIP